MRFLFIDSVPLTFGGGYEAFLLDLGKEARGRGHTVTVATPTPTIARAVGRMAGLTVEARFSTDDIHRRQGNAELVTGGLLTLGRVLRKADVVYMKNEPHELLATMCLAQKDVPVVVGFHSAVSGRPGRTGKIRRGAYNSRPYRALLRRAGAFHTLQPAQTEWLVERHRMPREKVHCIPNGIDLARFRPSDRRLGDTVRLLFVGRLDVQKGIDTVIEALEVLESSDVPVSLTVAGDGPLRDLVERAQRRSASLSYVGHIAETAPLMSTHDLLIAPSRWEVSALVPAEALACGVPVITSSIPENRIYDQTPAVEFCSPDDPGALAKTIINIVEDLQRFPERHPQLRRAARRFAEEAVDQGRSMTRLLVVLERLVGQ